MHGRLESEGQRKIENGGMPRHFGHTFRALKIHSRGAAGLAFFVSSDRAKMTPKGKSSLHCFSASPLKNRASASRREIRYSAPTSLVFFAAPRWKSHGKAREAASTRMAMAMKLIRLGEKSVTLCG